ncbi:MAG: chitobiase/beta-hexosaminidase C-terminal domain-containing protein [Prevotella sp.]|nr:chitobiase/beta-hexosaminidase C-terminal domain-containing protein [Prevotella sp.]
MGYDYVAFDVAEAGTAYAIVKSKDAGAEGRTFCLGFQAADKTYTSVEKAANNVPTELKHSNSGPGTYFLYASQAFNVIAVQFVPKGTTEYDITKESTNGTLSVKNGEADVTKSYPGETLNVSTTPNTGYTLSALSWNKTGASTDPIQLTSGDSFSMPANNATVTATWIPISYTISYNLDGGSVATDNPTSYTIESAAITLNNPTRDGYTFAGWTGTGLDAATTTVIIPQGSTGDRSYTATWTEIPTGNNVTVSPSIANGTISSDKTSAITSGETVTLTVAPTSGYQLKTLSINEGSVNYTTNNTLQYSFTMPATAVTVTAEFEAEATISTLTTWKFDDTTAYPTSEVRGIRVKDGLYMRNKSDGTGRNFRFADSDETTAMKFSNDNVEFSPSRMAVASGKGNISSSVSTAGGTGTLSSGNVSDVIPFFAFNASVPGTVYALVKGVTGSKCRIYFVSGTTKVGESNTNKVSTDGTDAIIELKYTSTSAGSFFIGSMDNACQIYAIRFVPTHNLKVTAGAGGTVTVMKGETNVTTAVAVENGAAYDEGTAFTLTATANGGYTFAGWSDGTNIVSADASYPVTLNSDVTLTATFTASALAAPTIKNNNGTVTITKNSELETVTTYYTTDGTDPTSASTLYTAALTITSTMTIKAINYNSSSSVYSDVASMTVTIPTTLTSNSVGFVGLGTDAVSVDDASNFTIDTTNKTYSTNSTNPSSLYANGAIFTYTRGDGVFTLSSNSISANKPLCSIKIPGLSEGQTVFVRIAGNSSTATTISCTDGGTIDTDISSTTLATNSAYSGASDLFIKVNEESSSITLQNAAQGFNLFRIAKANKLTTNISGATGEITVTPAAPETKTISDGNLGNGYFVKGTSVTVTAPVVNGYIFTGWSNGTSTVSTAATYTFDINSDITLTANYEEEVVAPTTPWTINYAQMAVSKVSYGNGATAERTTTTKYTVNSQDTYPFHVGDYLADHQLMISRGDGMLRYADVRNIGLFNNNKNFYAIQNLKAGDVIEIAYNGGGDNNSMKAVPALTDLYNLTENDGEDTYTFKFNYNGDRTLVYTVKTLTVTANGAVSFALTAGYIAKISVGTTYTVNATVETENTGTVSVTTPAYMLLGDGFASGSNVTLKAEPAAGYEFKEWKDGDTQVATTVEYTISNLSDNKTLTAVFEQSVINYTLKVVAGDNGSVKIEKGEDDVTSAVTADSGAEYVTGTSLKLTATPATGYEFVNWTNGTTEVSTENPYTVSLTESMTLTANFQESTIPTEETVSEETTWTFNGYTTTDVVSTCAEAAQKPQIDKLYNRSATSGRGFTFVELTTAENITFTGGDQTAISISKVATSSGNYNNTSMNAYTAGSAGNNTTPFFAFNTTVAGTCYAYVKSYEYTKSDESKEDGDIRIYFGKGDGTTSLTNVSTKSKDLTEIKLTAASAGTFFIGGVSNGARRDIYAIRFVPTPVVTKYDVTVPTSVDYGTVVADLTEAAEGETVTLTVTPDEGYMVDELTVKNGTADIEVTEVTANTTYTFVMPAAAPTIAISFKAIPTIYATYDFRSFANNNLSAGATASIGKSDANVMTGSFTGITNTMTLNDAVGISYDQEAREIKLVKGEDDATTGIAIPRGSADQVAFYLYGLKSGDWFKVETGEVPLYINKVNNDGTIYFYDIDDTSKTNVARKSEIVSGHTYVASQDITSMELNYNTSNTGNIYIYSAQLSNGDAVPSPTIGSYDFTTGKVEITANNSLKGNVPTAIYYTTDGTDPTTVMDNDHKYTGAIALTEATTIKAVAVLGEIKSTVAEKLVELETVNVPEVGELTDGKVTITAGTSTNPAVTTNTTYYTLDGSEPSAENNDGSFTEASKAIEIDQTRWLKTVTISSTGVSSDVKAQKVVVDAATPSTVIDFVKDVTELKYGKENLLMYYYYNDGDTNEAKYNKNNAKFNYIVNPEVHTRLAVLSSDQNAVSSTADGLKVLNNGRPIAINDLHAGDKVYVTYTSTSNMKTAIYPERGDVVTIGGTDVESKDTEVKTGQEVVVKTVSTDYNYLMLMPVKDMIITKIEINPSFTITNMTASDSGVTGVKVIKVDDKAVDETFASEETKSFIRGSKVTLQASYTAETGKSLLWLDAEDNELEANADGTLTLTVDADLKVKALYTTGITVTDVKNAENKMVARKLNNGLLEVTFDNNGRITAIKDIKSGKEVMASDDNNQRGYFNFNYRPSKDANVIDFGLECKNSGDIVQIGKSGSQQVELIYPTADAATPSHQTWKIGYVMKAGVSGIYTYVIMDGSSSYSELHEARYGWRVNPNIFNYAWVSDSQKGKMPTPTQMKNYVEEVQDATYKLDDGTIYTKYDWANFVKDDQLHGIMGDGIGAWLISPSAEWVNGGPQKQELTVHATDTTPIILQTMHSRHFGAGEAVLESSDDKKLFGPCLFYVNTGASQDAMIQDAKIKAAE